MSPFLFIAVEKRFGGRSTPNCPLYVISSTTARGMETNAAALPYTIPARAKLK